MMVFITHHGHGWIVQRKFYRWFPDFQTRSVRDPDCWTYRPKAGHDEEVEYRRAMREKDKEMLIHKRKVTRSNDQDYVLPRYKHDEIT
jgi:hypothetical protein